MSWEQSEKRSEEGASGGKFVRLADDGDKVVGAFMGEPHVRDLVWNQKLNRYEDLTPERIAAGEKGTPKFSLNFWVPAEKAMKIIEVNNQTFKDIIECKRKYGLDKWLFEIKRKGKKGDTKTTYSILPERELTTEEKKASLGTELHDLVRTPSDAPAETVADAKKQEAAKTTNGTNGTAAPTAEFISGDDAKTLVDRVRALPKDKVTAFLDKFGVKQIKLIKASDRETAFAYLGELEGKPAAPPPAAETEIDPFA